MSGSRFAEKAKASLKRFGQEETVGALAEVCDLQSNFT